MTLFVNTDDHHRIWPHLTNEDTGRTLALEPGEECELKLASADDGFDPYLKPVKGKRGKPAATFPDLPEDHPDQGEPESKPSAIPVV